jgi:hypothetical protein
MSQADPVLYSWRRFLRFSVRGLIVLVLVIGGGLGWIVREARIQRDAVAAIARDGGKVFYDWEWRDGHTVPGGKPPAPSWLADLIGVDYFGHVTYAWLSSTSNPLDAVLAHVGRLTRVQFLVASRAPVSDSGLLHLKGLTELSSLILTNTHATDAGLAHLKGLTKLSYLNLGSTQISDAGLEHLKGLTNLKWVYLDGTRITDAGLEHLKGLISLDILRLNSTQVTDAGVNDLKQALPSLTIIR